MRARSTFLRLFCLIYNIINLGVSRRLTHIWVLLPWRHPICPHEVFGKCVLSSTGNVFAQFYFIFNGPWRLVLSYDSTDFCFLGGAGLWHLITFNTKLLRTASCEFSDHLPRGKVVCYRRRSDRAHTACLCCEIVSGLCKWHTSSNLWHSRILLNGRGNVVICRDLSSRIDRW